MVWTYFTHKEYSKFIPEILEDDLEPYEDRASRHSVTVVDYTLYNGEKALVIEDSAHFGGISRRVYTEKFFSKRNFFAGHMVNFKFENGSESNLQKPKYKFTKTLKYSPIITYGNTDIIALQDCLKYEGLFPINSESTGYFGPITQKYVKEFQAKYGLTQDGIVGPRTCAQLNSIFSN
jgi:hypothetical protein